MANFFDRFDAPAPQREDQQRNFFDQFDEQQEKKQPNFFDKFDEARPVAEPAPREQAIPPSQPEESSFIRQALDIPLGITKGAVSGFRMIADAFGAGNFASEAIKSSEKYLEGLMSAQSRNDSAEVSRIMQDAEDKGFGDQVRAAIKAFAVAPVDLVSQALGTAAPVILGGLATTVLRGGALAASTVTTGLAGTTGAGLIKGNIYDAVKEEMIKAGDSPDVAEKKAQEAQAYGGKNLDMILAGTALGALAGRTGVEKLILNKIAGKEAAEQGLLRRAGEGAVTEAAPEFVQAGQEALATNVALQREGFDVPTMRGVVGQATLEGLAGSALGATTGALSKPRVAADTAEDKAIAALDKLAADEEAEELKLEESILARANEIIGEFSDDGQTISMDDAYARARFELVEDKPQAATSGLVGEADLFAEEAVGRIPAAEIVPATKEELKKIDKDLKKKLGRVPTTAEVGKAIDDFEQEKTRRLRAESGGRKPPVSVPSGEEAAAGVTGAPARTEPTGLGESVGAAASVGTRKEPTTGALKPEDLELDAAIKSGDINKLLSSGLVDYKELDTLGLQNSLTLARKRLDLRKEAAPTEAETTETAPAATTAPELPQAQPDEARMPIQRSRDVSVTAVPMSLLTTPEALQRAAKVLAVDPDSALEALNTAAKRGGLAGWEAREIAFGPEDQAPTQTYEEALAENYKRRGLDNPDEVSKEIQESRNVSKKVADAYVQALRKRDEERIKWSYGLGSEQAFREAGDLVEKIENRIRGVEKRREGKQPLSTEEAAAPTGFPSMAELQSRIDALPPVSTFTPPDRGAEKREAKAKKERSKAIAKMAAELGGTADEDGGFRPARDEEGVETIKTKADVNKERLADLLGQKLYGATPEMPFVSVKEMVQNAFDAIKPMQEKGQLERGKIDITVDKNTRAITVVDNGTGMTPETLSTTFLTIAGTKKEGDRASGGLGIAKMQFLFGNDEIQVVTMRDGVASVLRSDGATIKASMSNPDVDLDITVYKGDDIPNYIKDMLPEGHGTYVNVVVPKSYLDSATGEEKPIEIFDYYSRYKVLENSPLFGNIDVEFNGRKLDIGANFPYEDYTTFANVKFDWGVARIYVQKEPQKYMWGSNTSILSNGLWQFDVTLQVNDEIIPRRIYVDVSPKKEVKPEDVGYPFDLNRQRFSPPVEKSFNQIFKYLQLVYKAADFASSADNFGSIQYLDLVGRNDDVQASPLEELTPTPTSEVFTATDISQGDQVEVKDGVLYVKGKAVRELTDADMKAATIDFDELKIDESLIFKDRVMLHINAGIAEVDDKKLSELRGKESDLLDEMIDKHSTTLVSRIQDPTARAKYKEKQKKIQEERKQAEEGNITSIADIGRQKFGAKFDKFLFEIGNAFLELRNFAATLDPSFANFTDEAVGVSLDSRYRGVSIKLPFAGVFINPFAPQYTNLSAAAAGTLGTMVHELAHVNVRDHGASFASEMQKINLLLRASQLDGDATYDEIEKSVIQAFRKYKDVFEYFNKELTDGKLKPIGKRLSDSSEEQIGDAGGTERVAGFRGATEGEPDISGRPDLSSKNIGEERERARDAGEATTSELEQRIIELGLKSGDIHPTMVSAISNNDLNGALRIASQRLTGFSADLAKALLDLKLPTNISFNTGQELVRRSIDYVSQAEQERLFRFVQMHYPQVYDKYFKNYDRSESLETVAAGLIELQKPNYKLGPVVAEFDTVSSVYKKYIEGLTAPGAYYPDFDEIALNTDTLSGKSYRVFLHEVVHAATEYVLDTAGKRPQELTPGQRAAAEELTKMYNYAVEKLGEGPYGMTNIYEFVAEVFTNKKFQELLKGVKYETKKVPFFTRLVRAIFKAVGLDNLAGNAMVEATKIFSAVRKEAPLTRGPRFAAKGGPKGPRIRGPISQTWRTAEDVARSAVEMLSDAIKGRRKWEGVLEDIRDSMWDTKTGVFRRAVLGFANLRQIDDLTKTKFPQIAAAIRMIEQMLAYRGNIMKSAEDITKKWTEAKAKNPKQDRLMSRIMIEATIRGLDPDRPGAKQMNAALVQAWNQLDPEFKQIYREVRDFYATSVNNMVREMKLKVAKSTMTLTEKKAAIREINDKFGPDKLVQPYFPLRRFGKYWFQVGKGNFKEFYEFEDQFSRELAMRSRIRELSKGNAQQKALAETIRKGNGLSELFSQNRTTSGIIQEVQNIVDSIGDTQLAPTQEQYNRAERALKKELNRTPTRDEVLKRFEKDATKKELKDSLNQMLYILLPQQSMRKMFINRKAVQGASSDMLRVFATSAVHSAYQQSRFKYAEAFLNNLSTAIDYVEEFADRDRAAMYREYIAEVEKRASTILSNEDTSLAAKAAGKASELTFFYMLSAPFSAMLNILGVGAITMPYIGGRYGYAKTNALMIKNFGRYLATSPSRTFMPLAKGNIMQAQFPSIAEGGQLTGVLKKAADRFIEEGQINISLTNDLMDMGERPSELYTGRYNMVKKMLSGLFHQSERLGREVSLLTTFELAYDKFSKSPKKDLRGVIERDAQGNPIMNTPDEAFELAISEAKDIVGLSLGDFTRQMKPRYFTPPLLSVLTKFKQYSVLATYAVVRNFYFTVAAPFRKKEIEEFRQQMLKDKISPQVIDQRVAEAEAQRKELYREGRRRLAGILGVTYLLGGNEASPFYSIGLGTLIKLLANEDDDEFFDWENWLKNYMEEELGGAAGDMFAELGMDPKTADKAGRFVGGSLQRGLVAEITGGELASRVSLDPKNLWYREGRYSPDVRESIIEDVIANAGPVVGLGFNWIDSYKLFQEGQYQRAFEKAAPALVSKPVAAARIAEEDARTASGIRLADNFSAWELSMLSIGLQPARLAQAQKSAIEAKQYSEKVKDRRATLLDRLWMERDSADGFNETLERIKEFSQKYPNHRIEPKDILESFERRGENQAIAEAIGGQFEKKSIPQALQMLRYGRE